MPYLELCLEFICHIFCFQLWLLHQWRVILPWVCHISMTLGPRLESWATMLGRLRLSHLFLQDAIWDPALRCYAWPKYTKMKEILKVLLYCILNSSRKILFESPQWIEVSLWHMPTLTLKMPRKAASENVVCLCRLLNILANFSNLFLHTGKQCWHWSDCS